MKEKELIRATKKKNEGENRMRVRERVDKNDKEMGSNRKK